MRVRDSESSPTTTHYLFWSLLIMERRQSMTTQVGFVNWRRRSQIRIKLSSNIDNCPRYPQLHLVPRVVLCLCFPTPCFFPPLSSEEGEEKKEKKGTSHQHCKLFQSLHELLVSFFLFSLHLHIVSIMCLLPRIPLPRLHHRQCSLRRKRP